MPAIFYKFLTPFLGAEVGRWRMMKILSLVVLLLVVVGAIYFLQSGKMEAGFGKPPELVKITRERVPMDERLLSLCVGPGAVVGPHAVAEVDVYVNDQVIQYRKENPEGYDYPVGSQFVKKKYPDVGVTDPDIATIMVRRGSEGSVSDWEFRMESLPDGNPVEFKGRVSCAECHERYESRGYISHVSEMAMREHLNIPVPAPEGIRPL